MNKLSTFAIVGIDALLLASCGTNTETSQNQVVNSNQDKPNVIIFYTDDQGSIDLNCYGATDLQTPNIDKIAQNGVRFTQFYAASPVSSPSRAALMTGKNPLKTGLPDNAPSKKGHEGGLPNNAVTIAEVLKDNGYKTAHIGKWHLGYTPETMPNAQGFDFSFGHMGGCIDNYSHFFYWSGPNAHDLHRNGKEVWHDGQYFPDLMLDEAKDFIDKNKEHPFFMYYAINMPHYPLQAKEKWREYYKNLPSPRKEYAAFVSSMDENIGSLYTYLEKNNLLKNTLIIFQSDQGHSTEIRTFGGGGNPGQYRGCKFSLFEGGIRIPAIASLPGKIPANEVRDQMACNIDWFPTILDFCNVEYDNKLIEGKSIKQVIIDNKETPHKHLVWKYGHQWAVRKGDYKLLYKPLDPRQDPEKFWQPVCDSLYLVDIKNDIGEKTNLSKEKTEIAKELNKIYTQWKNDSTLIIH